jgi:hypothetical protein
MTIPMMLAVRSDFPARTVGEFVELARKREKPLSFGSGNTSSRGAAELFRYRQAIEMQDVPYRGMPQALTDVMGGQIDCVFADPASAQGLVQDGKLRALAVTSAKRLETMPDLPTVAESGLPGYELTAWVGVFVRAKTPPEIISRLNALVTGETYQQTSYNLVDRGTFTGFHIHPGVAGASGPASLATTVPGTAIDASGTGMVGPFYTEVNFTNATQALTFGNLLFNACKYTERGGRIWLTVERQGSDVVVKVEDGGMGMVIRMAA